MSKELMGKKPLTLITDGLPAYNDAFKKEFLTIDGIKKSEHIREITLMAHSQ